MTPHVVSVVTPQNLEKIDVPSDVTECQHMIHELVGTLKQAFGRLDEQDDQIQELQHRLELLLQAKYGRSSEKVTPGQLRLFEEAGEAQQEEKQLASTKASTARHAGHGRKKLSKELPRRRIIHELPLEKRCCPDCGQQRLPIGEEVSERLGYIPACVEVVEDVRIKYACRQCAGKVVVADLPSKPIAKGSADASMIAYVATSKFADHLPLHRLEGIFRRHGLELVRSTMCGWLAAGADVLKPLYERMKWRVLTSRIIWTDDTPVDMQDRNHEKNIREARTWVYIGDQDNALTVYDFTDSRKRDGPANFLRSFRGYLQADAYGGYDGIYATKFVKEVACWAHARRKFKEALNSNKRTAGRALRYIQVLYRIERRYAGRDENERLAIRQSRSRRVLAMFKKWLDVQVAIALKGPLAKAVKYTLNQWEALNRYTDDGELSIDNNKAERALRSVAVGRKNWMFIGSQAGGEYAAIWSSLIASCKQQNVEPLAYLTDVFNKLSGDSEVDLDSLLPDQWTTA